MSCKYNPDVDWLIFTDRTPPDSVPDNVKFVRTTVDDYTALCSRKLGSEVKLRRDYVYKLCDLKPALGLICEDYLEDYEFWGACDLDIIWGDIRAYVTDRMLSRFDIITSGRSRVWGHFTLFRNTPELKNLVFSLPDFEKALKNPDSLYRMAETVITKHLRAKWARVPSSVFWLTQYLQCGKPYVYWHWRTRIVTDGVMQKELLSSQRAYKWKQGKTYNWNGEELMYIHFHKLKKTMKPEEFRWDTEGQVIEVDQDSVRLVRQ